MDETWKRDLGRSHASADGASAFEHGNTVPIPRKLYRRREPVGARADDDGIVCLRSVHAPILDQRPGFDGESFCLRLRDSRHSRRQRAAPLLRRQRRGAVIV